MPTCSIAGSEPKPGAPEYLWYGPQQVLVWVMAGPSWLAPLVSVVREELIDIPTFCATAIPDEPVWTAADWLLLATPQGRIDLEAKFRTWTKWLWWNTYCQCVSGTTCGTGAPYTWTGNGTYPPTMYTPWFSVPNSATHLWWEGELIGGNNQGGGNLYEIYVRVNGGAQSALHSSAPMYYTGGSPAIGFDSRALPAGTNREVRFYQTNNGAGAACSINYRAKACQINVPVPIADPPVLTQPVGAPDAPVVECADLDAVCARLSFMEGTLSILRSQAGGIQMTADALVETVDDVVAVQAVQTDALATILAAVEAIEGGGGEIGGELDDALSMITRLVRILTPWNASATSATANLSGEGSIAIPTDTIGIVTQLATVPAHIGREGAGDALAYLDVGYIVVTGAGGSSSPMEIRNPTHIFATFNPNPTAVAWNLRPGVVTTITTIGPAAGAVP